MPVSAPLLENMATIKVGIDGITAGMINENSSKSTDHPTHVEGKIDEFVSPYGIHDAFILVVSVIARTLPNVDPAVISPFIGVKIRETPVAVNYKAFIGVINFISDESPNIFALSDPSNFVDLELPTTALIDEEIGETGSIIAKSTLCEIIIIVTGHAVTCRSVLKTLT